MEIHPTGFAKRSAEDFFETLKSGRIRELVDVRVTGPGGWSVSPQCGADGRGG